MLNIMEAFHIRQESSSIGGFGNLEYLAVEGIVNNFNSVVKLNS